MAKGSLPQAVGIAPGEASLRQGKPSVDKAKQDRLARWRFDVIIAATALVSGMRLVHNNAADFEAIRGAIEISPERFPVTGSLELVRCGALA